MPWRDHFERFCRLDKGGIRFIERVLAVIASILSIVALIFALTQFRDSHQVIESLSTRRIADFPHNIGELTRIVGAANQKLDIMVDVIGYGHYSNVDAFKSYFLSLIDKSTRLNNNLRMIMYKDISARPSGKPTIIPDPSSEQYNRFKKEHWRPQAISQGITWELIEQELQQGQRKLFDQLLNALLEQYRSELCSHGVQIKTVSHHFAFFLWLADGREAVFTFPNTESPAEISFRTQDANLIEPFRGVFDDIWENPTTLPACP